MLGFDEPLTDQAFCLDKGSLDEMATGRVAGIRQLLNRQLHPGTHPTIRTTLLSGTASRLLRTARSGYCHTNWRPPNPRAKIESNIEPVIHKSMFNPRRRV